MELVTFTVPFVFGCKIRLIPDSWHLHSFLCHERAIPVTIDSLPTDILYDSWSPAMTVSSICISILSMLSSSPAKVTYFLYISLFNRWVLLSDCNTYMYRLQQRPADNDRYVRNCRNGRSPKETTWWFHDDTVWWVVPAVVLPAF
jgi:hypothetical protein